MRLKKKDDENYEEDKDNQEVDYYGNVGPFFGSIADEEGLGDYRENLVSMVGEGQIEV